MGLMGTGIVIAQPQSNKTISFRSQFRNTPALAWPLVPDVILPVLDEAKALPWVLQRMPAGYRPILDPEFPWSYFDDHGASPAPPPPPKRAKRRT